MSLTSSSVSSTTRTSGSGSTSSSSVTTTSAAPFFSQTFTTPPPGTQVPPNPTDGGTPNGNTSLASSASLYLYTFLATLVLLLSVSAAIILRSLLLRRRHRRMVEEAIRNGTWIPPSPGGLGGFGMGRSGRVDLNKKPKLWEAFVEKEDTKGYKESEWDWDSIRPFSATVVTSPTPSQPPPQPIFPALASDSGPLPTTNNPPMNDMNNMTSERMPLSRRIRQFISPPPPIFVSPLPERNIPSNINVNSTPNVNDTVSPSGPQKIRVSVLIAMPSRSQSPPRSVPIIISPSPLMLSPSPSPSMNSSTPLTHPSIALTLESSPLGLTPPSPSPQEKEDEEIPYLEFGVAEFLVREEGAEGKEDVDARVRAEGKRPLSMGSSMDAV